MKLDSDHYFNGILSQFCLEETILTVEPFGSGHINGTYYLKPANPNASGYLLQRINAHVFKDISALMRNIVLVTAHLRQKLTPAEKYKQVLTLIPTHRGDYFCRDDAGDYWRVYVYMGGTKSYDQAVTSQQAYQSGLAFGQFQLALIDLDAGLLAETIPDFHNIDHRIRNLNAAVAANAFNRLEECLEEVGIITAHYQSMRAVLQMHREGLLPVRITHNDTKFNNVLLDADDRAQCVIDLDTVMPGLVAYDFGDAIRTIINTAPEDEADPEKIKLNVALFKAYTRGYLEKASVFLTGNELASLMPGALLLPYMQAVRFLTDYLEGDQYFKIHHPGHNLQRTRAQLQLVKKLQQNQSQLTAIINQLFIQTTPLSSALT